MGKDIYKYRGFSTAQMKSKADIPSASDIVDNTTYITCSNISLAAVKNLLGAATYSLYDICRHANINRWAAFSPIKRSVASAGAVLVNSIPSGSEGYSLGAFAGYNHTATTPHYESVTHDDNVDVNPGSDATFSVQIHLGEAKFVGGEISGVSYTDVGLALTVWNGSNILTRPDSSQVIDIHDLTQAASYLDTDKEIVELVTTYTVPAGETHALQYTCKIYLSSSLTGFASDLSNAICSFTELASYTKKLLVRKANFVYINGPQNNGGVGSLVGDVWTFGNWELKAFSWSPSTGILTFQYLKLNANLSGGSHLHLSVYVERGYIDTDGSTWVTEHTYSVPSGVNYVYDGSWNTAGSPPPDVVDYQTDHPSGEDIVDETFTNTNYGYRIVFNCNVT